MIATQQTVTAICIWFEDGGVTTNHDETALYYANQAQNVSKSRYMPYVLSLVQSQYDSKVLKVELTR